LDCPKGVAYPHAGIHRPRAAKPRHCSAEVAEGFLFFFLVSNSSAADCRPDEPEDRRRDVMRQIVISAFVSLDGIMQAPGGPEEDQSGGFRYGGWTVPYFDDTLGGAMGEVFATPFDLLLGRKTYDIFAGHWPKVSKDTSGKFSEPEIQIGKRFDACTKYVATHRPETLAWENSKALVGDVVAKLRELKAQDGPMLLTQGSSTLVQLLLEHDLVDELRLLTFPVMFGKGKRWFGEGSSPSAFTLKKSITSRSGVVIATYERAGEVKTGSFAMP
jgi:dihydrofolate reductase